MINGIPHCYILSLNIKSFFFFPPSLCLKQRQLYSKNLLDAFPVNPLSMFLYKHVFERTRKKQISKQTANERLAWSEEHGVWWSQCHEFVAQWEALFSTQSTKTQKSGFYYSFWKVLKDFDLGLNSLIWRYESLEPDI